MEQVWLSAGAFTARTLPGVLKEAEARCVRRVELSSGLPGVSALTETLKERMSAGMRFLVHNYFPAPDEPFVLNIASPDRENREKSLAFARRAVDIAACVKAPFYSLHAGFAVALTPELLGHPESQAQFVKDVPVDRGAALEQMRVNVAELADYASARDVRILLENNVISPLQIERGRPVPLLMTSPEETRDFMRAVSSPHVGLLLDVAHAKVSANALGFDPQDFFDECGEWLAALHISENDGVRDTNRPFDETAWFYPHLRGFDKPVVIEVYRMDAQTMAAQIAMTERALAA